MLRQGKFSRKNTFLFLKKRRKYKVAGNYVRTVNAFMSYFCKNCFDILFLFLLSLVSLDSSVGITTGCGLDGWGLIPIRGKKEIEIFFYIIMASGPAAGSTQDPFRFMSGKLSLGMKLSGHEASSNAKINTESILLYIFMAWCLIKLIIV
jgi:hypothetical protein